MLLDLVHSSIHVVWSISGLTTSYTANCHAAAAAAYDLELRLQITIYVLILNKSYGVKTSFNRSANWFHQYTNHVECSL
jgi:hypothetical protein